MALVTERERWALWSVVRLSSSSVTPQSFLSLGHTTLVQPPITLDKALRAIKPIWSTDFRMSSRALLMVRVDDFPDSVVSHGFVSLGP